MKFVGHISNGAGLRANPAKTAAIEGFPLPKNVIELQCFYDMVNQLGKFLPRLADLNWGCLVEQVMAQGLRPWAITCSTKHPQPISTVKILSK